MARVSIQTADFDVAAEIAALRAGDARVGAVCSFVGTVRDREMAPTLPAARGSLPPEGASLVLGRPGDEAAAPTLPAARGSLPPERAVAPSLCGSDPRILSLELEHYPGMTEASIEAMIDAAHARFDILGARVVHRVGLLHPSDQIVLVAVTSAHRGQSFQACEFLMDYLKTQAPFWKKEATVKGSHWVDARVTDDAAMARWGLQVCNAAPPKVPAP